MKLVSLRIITADANSLAGFYEKVTGLKAIRYTEDFAEIKTPVATLAIGSTRTLELFGGEDMAEAAANRTAIIEFLVDDVDEVFDRLKNDTSVPVVQEPTTMPWGNRSLLSRDPDGNLVNFFTPVLKGAVEKLEA